MTQVLVTGAGGMLGKDLLSTLKSKSTSGLTHSELDIRNKQDVLNAVEGYDIVINAAAYTRVDDAESEETLAHAINAEGPRNLAAAAKTHGARLIQLSTDYVFDGMASLPYQEDAATHPISAYGRTKEAGERAVLEEYPDGSIIVRTSWLYGQHGSCFPASILTAAQHRDTLQVVNDQIGQPTWTKDVAFMIKLLIDKGTNSGVYHATNAGQTSWFGFATKLFELAGWESERVVPVGSEEYIRAAPRPAWSVLGHQNWATVGLPAPRHWEEALEEAWASGLAPTNNEAPAT
jgi:dTDP-4-dehydrorhamnose reductase